MVAPYRTGQIFIVCVLSKTSLPPCQLASHPYSVLLAKIVGEKLYYFSFGLLTICTNNWLFNVYIQNKHTKVQRIFTSCLFGFKEVFSEISVLMYGLYSRVACNQERLMMARVRQSQIIFYTFGQFWTKILKNGYCVFDVLLNSFCFIFLNELIF